LRQSGPPSNPLELFIEPKKKWKLIRSLKNFEATSLNVFYYPHPLGPKLTTKDAQNQLASINSRIGLMLHATYSEKRLFLKVSANYVTGITIK
jgi:hypothetical protein